MAASYTQEERHEARKAGRHLATIDVAGMRFSGVVNDEERDEIAQFLLDFQKRRRAVKTEATPSK